MKNTRFTLPCQCRIGRVTLHPRRGYAVLPVEENESGSWTLTGLLRVFPSDVRLAHFPTTHKERQRFVRRAVGRAYASLRDAVQ